MAAGWNWGKMKKPSVSITFPTISLILSNFLVLALATGGSPVYGISLEFVGIGAYLGLVGTYLPYLVYLILFRNYNVTRISPFFFIIPAISIAFSVLFLHETIGLLTVAGFGIISLGIFLSNR